MLFCVMLFWNLCYVIVVTLSSNPLFLFKYLVQTYRATLIGIRQGPSLFLIRPWASCCSTQFLARLNDLIQYKTFYLHKIPPYHTWCWHLDSGRPQSNINIGCHKSFHRYHTLEQRSQCKPWDNENLKIKTVSDIFLQDFSDICCKFWLSSFMVKISNFTFTRSLSITLDVGTWILAGRNWAETLVVISLSIATTHWSKDLFATLGTIKIWKWKQNLTYFYRTFLILAASSGCHHLWYKSQTLPSQDPFLSHLIFAAGFLQASIEQKHWLE